VDAGRFLNRVTRAFEAAQDRGGEVRLRLSPPELGSLKLDIRVHEGVLVARLETETAAARTVLVENLPALRERLSEQGIRIERFDIDLMQQPSGGPPDQPQDRPQPELARAARSLRPTAAPAAPASAPVATTSRTAAPGGLNVII
jgi:flagellar hook-length control protein FliK